MVVVGVITATLAAFAASSAYYAVATPLERRVLGDAALDRRRPALWKVLTELMRTAVVAAAFAWIASRAGYEDLPGGLLLALVLWAAFPVVLFSGSVMWERVAPITATMHAGDWLIKLLLITVAVGLLH